MHERVHFEGQAAYVLDGVRRRALAYPETAEVEQFGHPWFKAGKRPFCIVGIHEGHATISFSTPREDQDTLCAMGLRPTPYMHQHGWVTMDVGTPDWDFIEALMDDAYRNVALKRMLVRL